MKNTTDKKRLPLWFWWLFWVSGVVSLSVVGSLSYVVATCLTCLQDMDLVALLALPVLLLDVYGMPVIVFAYFSGVCLSASMVLMPYILWKMFICRGVKKNWLVVVICFTPIIFIILSFTFLFISTR